MFFFSYSSLITFDEFQAFEANLCQVDAQYRIIFEMFDLNGKGTVTFGTFVLVVLLQSTEWDELLLIMQSLIYQMFTDC